MAKAILISIQPKWCQLIASGRKTIELRKTKPKLEAPFKVYIYCTKYKYGEKMSFQQGKTGKVIGEFVCDWILGHCEMSNADIAEQGSCVRREKILQYAGEKEVFGWYISNLVIYDKPKALHEFQTRNYREVWSTPYKLERPPQSWCYVEELPGGGSDG